MTAGLKTPDTRQEQDEAHNPYSDTSTAARNLAQQEEKAGSHDDIPGYDRANDGLDKHPDFNGDSDEAKKNISSAKEKEENSPGSINYTGSGEKNKQGKGFWSNARQKGPIAAIIGILIAGVGGVGFFSSTALFGIKAQIVNKLESMSSVVEERANLNLKNRMFGTSATCKLKLPTCKYKGLTARQHDRLTSQGAQMLDADGKPIKKNIFGYYVGGKTLVMPDGKTTYDAKNYIPGLKRDPNLRGFSKSIFASRLLSFNDKISKDIRARKRLTTNPSLGEEGNEKDTRKKLAAVVSGEAATASADPAHAKNPDGTDKPNPIDLGESADDINKEITKLQAATAAGDVIPELTSDPAEVMTLPEVKTSGKALKAALGFLNPADILTGLCSVYQFANITLMTDRIYGVLNNERFGSFVMAMADKFMAGDGVGSDMTKTMDMMQKPDSYGDAFGESFMYNFVTYGTIVDKPLTASANGNGVIQILSQTIKSVDSALGGHTFVMTSCGILTNPFVQGALSLTSLIPGGGSLTKGVTAALSAGVKATAKTFIKEKILANLTKDGLKNAGKTVTAEMRNFATKGPAALFLAGDILNRYGIPYIAQKMTGADLINPHGVHALDATGSGFASINLATGMERGLGLMTKKNAKAFLQFNNNATATYIADMRRQSQPFDFNNPYSAGSTFVASFYPLLSHFGVLKAPTQLLSLPSAILASLNPSKIFASSVFADDNTDAALAYCDDEFKQSHDIATWPDCNAIPGFNDMNMLLNVDNYQVADRLGDAQLDNDNNPKPGSTYEKFKAECITNSSDKLIGDYGGEDAELNPDCYGAKDNTTEHNLYRVANIDKTIDDAMENPPFEDN